MKPLLTGLVCFYLAWASLPVAAADAAGSGAQQAAICAACHGADGNSATADWPKLAGQSAIYMVRQLKAFKDGSKRKNDLMTPIVANMSDADMQAVAEYFAQQKRSIGVASKAALALGEKIYLGGNPHSGVPACVACHGPRGNGNDPAGFPALGGQHAKYTAKQLNDYKSGVRTTGASGAMVAISPRMSAEEIDAVSAYLEGLH